MRFLVGIDNSNESRIALDVALRQATPQDYIILAAAVEPPQDDDALSLIEQQTIELDTISALSSLGERCLSKRIPYSVLVLLDPHPGKMLCKIAEEHNVDMLLVGRRDMSQLKRMVVASTSKYCMENACCNVVVVKRPLPEVPAAAPLPPTKSSQRRMMATEYPSAIVYNIMPSIKRVDESVQTDLFAEMANTPLPVPSPSVELTHKLEEAEWKQYLQDNKRNLKESRDNLELTRLMEDKERQERINEIEAGKMKDKEERAHFLHFVKKLEEEERSLRTAIDEMEEWERSSERANEARAWAREQEEEERYSRMYLDDEEKWERSAERAKEARAWARKVEEQERIDRLNDVTNESRVIDFQNSKAERQRRLRKIKIDEEIERQRRIQKLNELIEAEKNQRAEASMLDLERVKILEEEERQRRMKRDAEENMRQAITARVQTYRDLQLVKGLEEEERARRISEMDSDNILRSSAALKLKELMKEREQQISGHTKARKHKSRKNRKEHAGVEKELVGAASV